MRLVDPHTARTGNKSYAYFTMKKMAQRFITSVKTSMYHVDGELYILDEVYGG